LQVLFFDSVFDDKFRIEKRLKNFVASAFAESLEAANEVGAPKITFVQVCDPIFRGFERDFFGRFRLVFFGGERRNRRRRFRRSLERAKTDDVSVPVASEAVFDALDAFGDRVDAAERAVFKSRFGRGSVEPKTERNENALDFWANVARVAADSERRGERLDRQKLEFAETPVGAAPLDATAQTQFFKNLLDFA